MATNGFKGIAGFRKQIIDNCYFFTNGTNYRGDISLIITHEPIGTYKAIVLSETNRRRDVVLSSDGNDTVAKALEQLLTKSADAVQQYITTNGFSRLPSDVDNDDDGDGVSSVSSYVDEPEKDHLADSSLSLESDMYSAYESPSEDGRDTISYSRARTGGRPRSYDVRTVRRSSRSRSRSHERTNPAYRKAPAPPARFTPAHLDQGHHRARPDAPPGAYYKGPADDGSRPNSYLAYRNNGRQMPPRPMPMGAEPPETWPNPRLVTVATTFPPLQETAWDAPNGGWGVSRPFPGDMPRGPVGTAGPMGPVPPMGSGMGPMGMGLPPMGNWQPGFQTFPGPRGQPPRQPANPARKPPAPTMEQGIAMKPGSGHPDTFAAASSTASWTVSSSASSTPTITRNPHMPPEYSSSSSSPPASHSSSAADLLPAKIDYRLVIKTPLGGRPLGGGDMPPEHRIIARTQPTRGAMRAIVLRYVMQNAEAFRREGLNVGGSPHNLRLVVTRAVLGSQGDSYDLVSYPEDDFSRLCESTVRGGASAWPLFEVTITNCVAGG